MDNIALLPFYYGEDCNTYVMLRCEKMTTIEEDISVHNSRHNISELSPIMLGQLPLPDFAFPSLVTGKMHKNELPTVCALREFDEETKGAIEFKDHFDLTDFLPHGFVYRTKLSPYKTYLYSLNMTSLMPEEYRYGVGTSDSDFLICDDGQLIKFYEWKDCLELPTAPLVETIIERRRRMFAWCQVKDFKVHLSECRVFQ